MFYRERLLKRLGEEFAQGDREPDVMLLAKMIDSGVALRAELRGHLPRFANEEHFDRALSQLLQWLEPEPGSYDQGLPQP